MIGGTASFTTSTLSHGAHHIARIRAGSGAYRRETKVVGLKDGSHSAEGNLIWSGSDIAASRATRKGSRFRTFERRTIQSGVDVVGPPELENAYKDREHDRQDHRQFRQLRSLGTTQIERTIRPLLNFE